VTDRSGEARNYTTRDDQGRTGVFYALSHDEAIRHHTSGWPNATGVRAWAETPEEQADRAAYEAAFHRGRRD
jgi:hypothetical protein